MTPSREYTAIIALERPESPRAGDVWIDRRHGIVKVINGHKRGQARRRGVNSFHLYHWGKPSLLARPCDWRDNDGNAFGFKEDGLRYLGNIFDMLPYAALAGSNFTVSEEAK